MRLVGLLLLVGSLAGSGPAHAQLPARIGVAAQLVGPPVTSYWEAPRSLGSVAPADSLPENMPLRVQLLWGQRGLMRTLGLAPQTRLGELRLRRSMLQWHQRLGLVTFGALTTQVILGELMANNPAKHYEDLRPVHRTLGYATFGVYMTTASLSLFAPPARRYGGFSSIKLHRWLALVHFTGMAIQPWLGTRLADARGDAYGRRLDQHRWAGRITLGAFTAALLSVFLPY